jgi:hypothetical protein
MEIDAEDFMRDLGIGRLVSLAMRMSADPDLDVAVGGEPDGRLFVPGDHRTAPGGEHGGSVRALLDEKRQADADQPAVGLAQALPSPHVGEPDGVNRAAQALRMIPTVEMLVRDVVERHLLRTNHVAQTQLVRFEAGLARNRIHDDFDRKTDAGSGNAPIRQDRTFVGRDRRRTAAIRGKDVRARQQVCDLRRLQAGRDRIDRVCTRIHGCDAIDGLQLAVSRCVSGDPIVMLPAVGVRGQMLPGILDPAHGMIEAQGQPRKGNLLPAQHALVAESATDVGRYDADVAVIEPQAFA